MASSQWVFSVSTKYDENLFDAVLKLRLFSGLGPGGGGGWG